MTDQEKEKYYDDVIAPKLLALAKDANEHGLCFLAMVERAPGYHGRTCFFNGSQGLPIQMANWAATCHSNVDAFWIQIQRYAQKNGHSSVFLLEQGIPSKPEQK